MRLPLQIHVRGGRQRGLAQIQRLLHQAMSAVPLLPHMVAPLLTHVAVEPDDGGFPALPPPSTLSSSGLGG
jgi:hypothetical protein